MKTFILICICSCGFNTWAVSFNIDQFLNDVKAGSLSYQQSTNTNSVNNTSSELELSEYEFSGDLSYNYLDVNEVNLSPFSPKDNNRSTYSLNLSKKWFTGITTSINYSLLDNMTTYPSGTKLDYLLPDLSLSLSSNIVSDVLYGKSRLQKKKVDQNILLNQIRSQNTQKQILTTSLLTFAELLKLESLENSQRRLCSQIKKQVRQLYKSTKTGARSKRDYYLSLKKMNNCEVKFKDLTILKSNIRKKLNVDYGVSFEKYASISLSELLSHIVSLYKREEHSPKKVNLEESMAAEILRVESQSLAAHEQQLVAENKLPLKVELKLGAKGLDDEIGDSHKNVSELNNPYISGTVKLDFPFTSKMKQDSLKVVRLRKEIVLSKLKLQNKQQVESFNTLSEKIKVGIDNQESLDKNVELSRQAFLHAQKDFNNGRIDFLVFSDYQTSLIESELQSSDLRLTVIADILTYLDYFNFFNRYY